MKDMGEKIVEVCIGLAVGGVILAMGLVCAAAVLGKFFL